MSSSPARLHETTLIVVEHMVILGLNFKVILLHRYAIDQNPRAKAVIMIHISDITPEEHQPLLLHFDIRERCKRD